MSDWIGRRVSKVEIHRRLGRGGMADVFLGQHTTLNRPVAVKILHNTLMEDATTRERFRHEAQAVAALRHPHIVQVFDFDVTEEGQPYMVMELVAGQTLEEYLQRLQAQGRRLPPETTVRLVTGLTAALDYAHEHGIIHRDIKPANILLRHDPAPIDPGAPLPLEVEAILTDFGISRLANVAGATLSGTLTGTPAYLSPEQAQGQPVDERSDIYSLGVVVYEMLAGHPPFEIRDGNLLATLLSHVQTPPPLIPGLHPSVMAVVQRALAKVPAERFARPGDLAAELLTSIFGASFPGRAADTPPLTGLLETLTQLQEQARIYERALPANNFTARAAIHTLGQLAFQAANEARDLNASLEKPSIPAAHGRGALSPREHEVLQLVMRGLTNKEIAYRLGLSERTVQFHLNSVFNKTTTQSRTEAVVKALELGWIGKP